MKLQKQVARVVGAREYTKWVITIPPEKILQLGWREGEELDSLVHGSKLMIEPATTPKNLKRKKMSYEEFRNKVAEALKAEPKGLTWTQVKTRLGLPEKVPNNLWVRLMEQDIGLIREKNEEGIMIWRLR